MSITGGIKFFKESKIKDATAESSVSGNASVASLLNNNRETFWRSSGSNDSTTEIITVTFAEDKAIDRIALVNTNAKNFNITYDVSGTWTAFANVVGIDGAETGINITGHAQDTAYYEFDSVTTGSIKIEIDTTQTVDAEKFINHVICTEELGTYVGYPSIDKLQLDRNQKNKATLNGRFSVQKSLETMAFKLKFMDYPVKAAYNADIDLCLTLMDSEDPFIVWLCGGRYGTDYFKYTLPGFRLKDMIQMQIGKAYTLSYSKNTYTNGVNISALDLIEVI